MEKLTTGRDAELAEHLAKVIVDGIRAEVELGGARHMESRARVTEDYRGRLRRCSPTSLKRLGHVTRNSSPNNSCGSTTTATWVELLEGRFPRGGQHYK